MFGWSKKKESKRRGRREESSEENEFGIKMDKGPSDKQLEAELKALAGVDLPEDDLNLNEGEEDEESELLRYINGGKPKGGPKKPSAPVGEIGNITGDITADLEDIGDEDIEVDENDPELLSELLELTQPEETFEDEPESDNEQESAPASGESDVMTILKERLKLYKTAEAKAKENNENSRARRFNRGIKTLEDLIKKAKAGKPVASGDIPPVIALNLKPAPPVQETPANENGINGEENILNGGGETVESPNESNTNQGSDEEDIMTTLTERLKLYKTAEAKAKESNEITRARRFNRGIKTLESLIQQARAGKPVAPGDIPPAVALNLKPPPPIEQPQPGSEEGGFDNNEEVVEDEVGDINLSESPSKESESKEEEPERNIMDVLSERLQMYRTAEAKAKETGESSRARRFGRGVKTIQDLIRQATAGKPISSADIPPPIALNLKPAPVVVKNEEEEPRESAMERDDLVRSSDEPTAPMGSPLKFLAADDVDLDEELTEEIPETVLEGLEQRLRIYNKLKEKAKEEEDEGMALQSERNIKIYLNAIRTYKSGGYVDVLSLPTPRGCPPIPIPFQIP